MLKRKSCSRAGKTALLPVNLKNPSLRLSHRSWDSMTHDTCTLILQCLVSWSCRKSPAREAIQDHSGSLTVIPVNRNNKLNTVEIIRNYDGHRIWVSFIDFTCIMFIFRNICRYNSTSFRSPYYSLYRDQIFNGSPHNLTQSHTTCDVFIN